jgi:hypothetical protein
MKSRQIVFALLLAAAVVAGLMTAPVLGESGKDELPTITATSVQGRAPRIDGIPDDWCGTHTSADFKLADGAAPKGSTRFNVSYDDKNLYVLVICPETEAELKSLKADATQDAPDEVWADDSVELFIDPTGARQSYYQLIANSKGVHWEGYHATANYPSPWNAHATVAAASNGKDCWAVEFAIPLSAFENTQKFSDEWAFNIVHSRIAANESLQWSPVHASSNHTPDRFGKLRGVPGKK